MIGLSSVSLSHKLYITHRLSSSFVDSKITVMDNEIMSKLHFYKEMKTSITKLENLLQYQEQIQTNHSIPKKFKPPQQPILFEANDYSLHNSFEQEYKKLFFAHLHHIITANKVTLELKKIRLQSTLQDIENHLSETPKIPDTDNNKYLEVARKLDITDQNLGPKLKALLLVTCQKKHQNDEGSQAVQHQQPTNRITKFKENTTTSLHQTTRTIRTIPISSNTSDTTPSSGTTQPNKLNRKRKNPHKHPESDKKQQTLTNYFLGLGRKSTTNPT